MKKVTLAWLIAFVATASAATVSASTLEEELRLYAKPMVADISHRRIDIHAQFSGAELLLYGARNAPGEMIAVITGPKVDVALSRKDKIAGMWMQVERTRYKKVPIYYRIASTAPLDEILPQPSQQRLQMTYPLPPLAHANAGEERMREAFLQKLRDKQWLSETPSKIEYFGETLFRASLSFPGNMPRGTYLVEVFLVQDGRIIAAQTMPLKAVKTGLDYVLYDYSRHRPWLYGIFAALISLIGGWLGNRLMRRGR